MKTAFLIGVLIGVAGCYIWFGSKFDLKLFAGHESGLNFTFDPWWPTKLFCN